jgi:O-acetyl-ADP-ribose deacetylase (regulator of RNase III)
MQIIYKTGDLLTADEPAIVHGCNAQGVMGSGVAKAIREHYPAAYTAYRQHHVTTGLKLGDTIWVACGPHTVINAVTQERYGSDGKRYVDYEAIRTAMREINRRLKGKAVAMPLIGAGLGGGSWPEIAKIIEAELTDVQPVVYTLDGTIPS